MQQIKYSSETPYIQLILDTFNIILGHDKLKSFKFWTKTIKKWITFKYGYEALTTAECETDYTISKSVNIILYLNYTSAYNCTYVSSFSKVAISVECPTFKSCYGYA
jgi:hypothetical protein